MDKEVYILGSARTAIGTFGGSLSSISPIELASKVSREAIKRARINAEAIGQVAFGHVINTEPKDMYLSRVAALSAGVAKSAPAMNVNRLCGSGAQAIVSIFQSLAMDDAEFGLAGGSESMSRSPHIMSEARWGRKMGDSTISDMMIGALSCPFGTGHMGVTAENVANEFQISRGEQDSFALDSQVKAKSAINNGRFEEQIVPIKINTNARNAVERYPKLKSSIGELDLLLAFAAINHWECIIGRSSPAGIQPVNAKMKM